MLLIYTLQLHTFIAILAFLRYRQFANLSADNSQTSPSSGITPTICPSQCCEDQQSYSHTEEDGDDTER